jgi:hypothetical protein
MKCHGLGDFSMTKQTTSSFINTSVAFAIGSNANTLRVQLIFPSKPNFCNFFEFQATKSIKK